MTDRRNTGLADILNGLREPSAIPAPPSPPKAARPRPVAPAPAPRKVRRGPGRPPGKRSNPKFKQITGLIERDLHRSVLLKLLNTGRPHDLGPILSDLLRAWVKQK